jgi:curved DNA-binding protein CbpA
MRAVNAAWRVLRDPDRRAAYDRQLARQAAPPATGPVPDKLANSPAPGQTTAPGSWWAILPPATLATSILLLLTPGYVASPPLLGPAGTMFALAIGLFVLAPLHAMTAAKGDYGRRTPW